MHLCRAVQNSSADCSLASLRYACRSTVFTCSLRLRLRLPTPRIPSQLVRSFVCSRTRTQSKHIRLTACSAFGAASLLLTSLHARLVLSVSALVDVPQSPAAISRSAPVPLARASSRFHLEFALLRASHTHSRAHSHCRSHSHSHSTRTRALAHSLLSALGNFCSFRSSTLMCLLSFRCAALRFSIPEFQLHVSREMDHRSKSLFLETVFFS